MSAQTEPNQTSKALLQVLAGHSARVPPVWLMRQAGRYLPEYRQVRAQARTFLDLCFTPELAVEVTLQPIRRYGFDAAILFSDILVVPHGLGQKVWFVEGEGPKLERIHSADELSRLDLEAVLPRLEPVLETVRRLSRTLPRQTTLVGFAGAPWTVATYMVEGGGGHDFHLVKRFAYADATGFARLIEILIQATTRYLTAQIRAGVEVVQLFDSWAGVLPEAAFRRWVIEPTRAIVQEVKRQHAGVPVIGFPRGAGALYADYVRETGIDAVSLDTTVPMSLAGQLQKRVAVQGNLDPQLVVVGGEPMRQGVAEIVDALRGGPFVFNLGHGIVPETPPEHVHELLQILRG